MFQHHSKEDSKHGGSQDATLFHSSPYVEGSRYSAVKDDGAFHVFVEGSDDAEKFGWTSDLGKDLEEAAPTDQIESLCEVYEGNEEWLPLFSAFLLKLFEGEDHVYSGSVGTEAALRLRVDLLCKYLEPLQYYTCKDFPNNTDEGYAATIIAIASVTFAFVECDDVSVPHVLWYFAFTLTEAEDFMQLSAECLFAALQYFSGNTVFPWCLARGKWVQSFAEFIYGWFSVKLFQLW